MYEIIQFFLKKPKKTQKNPILVGFFKWVFLGFFGWVFLGGYFVCPPCITCPKVKFGKKVMV